MKYTAATIGALAGTALLSSTALAADLYTPPPVYEPVVEAAPVLDYFSGPYIGLHGGWGWADANASYVDDTVFGEFDTDSECGADFPFGCAVDLDPEGAFVGAQIGWNFVFGNGLMLGIEGDYSFASLNDSDNELFDCFPCEQSHVDLEVDQMATVQARLGWVMGQWMPFLTGGWGWAHAERDVVSSFPAGFSTSDSNWHDGWTVGGGIEYAINQNWTVKAEYRYFDGSEETYGAGGFAGGTDVDLDIQTVRFGVNFGF